MHHPTDRITHTTVFVARVVEHSLKPEIAQEEDEEEKKRKKEEEEVQAHNFSF